MEPEDGYVQVSHAGKSMSNKETQPTSKTSCPFSDIMWAGNSPKRAVGPAVNPAVGTYFAHILGRGIFSLKLSWQLPLEVLCGFSWRDGSWSRPPLLKVWRLCRPLDFTTFYGSQAGLEQPSFGCPGGVNPYRFS